MKKYLVLGLLGIIGLAFVENQLLFFILIIYLIGCVIGFFKGDSQDEVKRNNRVCFNNRISDGFINYL